jgi:hypothetical protein
MLFLFQQYCKFTIDDVTVYLVYRSTNSPPEAIVELENLKSAGFLGAVEDALLEQMIDFPTHIKGNCLDLVLTNIPERIISIEEMGHLGSSDHEMICVTVGMQNRQDDDDKCGLNWKKANCSSMKEDTARIEWRQALQGRSAEEMWTFFRSEVEEIVK